MPSLRSSIALRDTLGWLPWLREGGWRAIAGRRSDRRCSIAPGTCRDARESELEGLWVWLLLAGGFLAGCSQDMSGYVSGLKSYSCQRTDRLHDCRQIPSPQVASQR